MKTMINRVRSRMALRRHEKQRQRLSSYDTTRVPVVGFLLSVGALLFFGLIGLSAWFEPALPDAAAKLRLAPTAASFLAQSRRRRPMTDVARTVCGVGVGEVVAAGRRPVARRVRRFSAVPRGRGDRRRWAFLLGIGLGAIASSPQT